MIKLVGRQLAYDGGRTLFVSIAIAASLALVLVLEGFEQGLYIQLKNAVLNRGGELIVTQSGVTNFIASRSVLPQMSREQIEAVDGVVEAHPMTIVPVIYERHGRKTPIFFMVYDTAGGPANIVQGKPISGPRQIVVDESLATMHDLHVGDTFVVSNYEFRISGLSRQAAAMFTSFSFITYDDLIDFYFNSDLVGDIMNLPLVSFFLLQLEPSADPARVAGQIEDRVPDVDVFLPEQLAANDVELGRTLFGPVMKALLSVSYLICLLVIGIIMFSAIYSRRRSLGVMKALGFTNASLTLATFMEALLLTAIAIPVSVLLAQSTGWIIETTAPLYRIAVTEPAPLLRTLVAAGALAALGALLPVRIIARLDPVIVFRA